MSIEADRDGRRLSGTDVHTDAVVVTVAAFAAADRLPAECPARPQT